MAFDTSRDSEAWTYVEKYQEEYTAISTGMETLKTDIKALKDACGDDHRSEEHTSELQSQR